MNKTKVQVVNQESGYRGMIGYVVGYVSFSGWQGGIAAIVVIGDSITSFELRDLLVVKE